MNLIVIEADKSEKVYWSDLWRYRELFFFLSWRDVLVRYKQTVIGVAWALIRPLLQMVILTFVFGQVARMPADGLPYAVMVLAGMLPWQFFSSAMTEASNSLITNASMLGKIYFPRLIIPSSAVIVTLIDFLISCVLMAGMMILYRVVPDWKIVLLPFFVGLAFLASMGIGLWLAALNVKYRDFRYVVPFIVQLGVYLTPVGYSSATIKEALTKYLKAHGYGPWAHDFAYGLFCLNPMVGVINGFRWCLGGNAHVDLDGFSVGASVIVTLILLVAGLRYFRGTEDSFADII